MGKPNRATDISYEHCSDTSADSIMFVSHGENKYVAVDEYSKLRDIGLME